MSWAAPSSSDVLTEFTTQEANAIQSAQGASGSNISGILTRVVAEIRDYIRAGGYSLDSDTTKIPLGLHNDAITITRWRLLLAIPALKNLQSEGRKDATERAEKKLRDIAAQKFSVEPPTAGTNSVTGSWNSENKLINRTHPVPRPGVQYSPQTGTYGNPDAPADNT